MLTHVSGAPQKTDSSPSHADGNPNRPHRTHAARKLFSAASGRWRVRRCVGVWCRNPVRAGVAASPLNTERTSHRGVQAQLARCEPRTAAQRLRIRTRSRRLGPRNRREARGHRSRSERSAQARRPATRVQPFLGCRSECDSPVGTGRWVGRSRAPAVGRKCETRLSSQTGFFRSGGWI